MIAGAAVGGIAIVGGVMSMSGGDTTKTVAVGNADKGAVTATPAVDVAAVGAAETDPSETELIAALQSVSARLGCVVEELCFEDPTDVTALEARLDAAEVKLAAPAKAASEEAELIAVSRLPHCLLPHCLPPAGSASRQCQQAVGCSFAPKKSQLRFRTALCPPAWPQDWGKEG